MAEAAENDHAPVLYDDTAPPDGWDSLPELFSEADLFAGDATREIETLADLQYLKIHGERFQRWDAEEVEAMFVKWGGLRAILNLAPWARCTWLNAGEFVSWLDERWGTKEQGLRLNGTAATVRRWRRHAHDRAHFATADKILTQLGGEFRISELPTEMWLEKDAG